MQQRQEQARTALQGIESERQAEAVAVQQRQEKEKQEKEKQEQERQEAARAQAILDEIDNLPDDFKLPDLGTGKVYDFPDGDDLIHLEVGSDGMWSYTRTKRTEYSKGKYRDDEVITREFDENSKKTRETTTDYVYDDKDRETKLVERTTIYEQGKKTRSRETTIFFEYKGDTRIITRYDIITDGNGKTISGKKGTQKQKLKDGEWVDEGESTEEDLDVETLNQRWTSVSLESIWYAMELAAQGGMGRFASLFMPESFLREWREKVDKFFCETILFGGKDCWASKICESKIGKASKGIAYMDVPGFVTRAGVMAAGERSQMTYPNESSTQVTEYLYKLNYLIENPTEEDIYFNVHLYGDRTTIVYEENIKLEKDKTYSKLGTSANIRYSTTMYNRICVKFDKKIMFAGKKQIEEVCNDITETTQEAMPYLPPMTEEERRQREEQGIVETDW